MALNVDLRSLEAAVRRMGAQPVKAFVSQEVVPLDPIDIELERGIELPDLKDIETDSGLLSYRGRQILLYIQDHGGKVQDALDDGSKGRRFHIADCRTLKEMREKGRFERYVVTNRLDGQFHISGIDWQSRQKLEGQTTLSVCQNCLKTLNYKKALSTNTKHLASIFDIGEFFSTYSSFFSHLPKRLAGQEGDGYTQDWPRIAAHFKADKNFTCESCGVDLAGQKSLLHVHHRNGVKGDNNPANLMALCISCHRKQPSHGHMFVRHQDTQIINRLRREQGKFKNTGWSQAFEFCDPAFHGLLDLCKNKGMRVPEVGIDVQGARFSVVANLELGWPKSKVGVVVTDEDREAATSAGWRVWTMMKALQDIDGLAASARRG